MIDQDPSEQGKSDQHLYGIILFICLMYECKVKYKKLSPILGFKNNKIYKIIKIRIESIYVYIISRCENAYIMNTYLIRTNLHIYEVSMHGKTMCEALIIGERITKIKNCYCKIYNKNIIKRCIQ